MGDGFNPSPLDTRRSREGHPLETGETGGRPVASRIAKRYRHKAGAISSFHAHQHVVLALRLCFGQRVAYVADIRDRLAADVENDVTGLQALLGGWSGRIDAGNHQALVARASDIIRRCECQAEMW